MSDKMPIKYGIFETRHETDLGGLPGYDHDAGTATVWTVHMPIHTFRQEARKMLDMATVLVELWVPGNRPSVIGYCGGDSFQAWCEPGSLGDEALHVYFTADPESAERHGLWVADVLGVHHGAVVTTAGDWAMQAWPASSFSNPGTNTLTLGGQR